MTFPLVQVSVSIGSESPVSFTLPYDGTLKDAARALRLSLEAAGAMANIIDSFVAAEARAAAKP